MQLLKLGDRGPTVVDLQKALNALPSALPQLVADGIFGKNTAARVCEFQRDNNLAVDGIVGPATHTRMQQFAIDPEYYQNFLFEVINEIGQKLAARERVMFVGQSRVFVRKHFGTELQIGAAHSDKAIAGLSIGLIMFGLFIAMCLIVMLMFVVAMRHSSNPKTRQRAEHWNREVEYLENKAKEAETEKEKAKAAQEALDKTKQLALEMHDQKKKEHKDCLDLNKVLNPNSPCMKALQKLKEALDSLFETLRKTPGGTDGFKPDALKVGIARAVGTLIAALADAADKCPNCSFLRI